MLVHIKRQIDKNSEPYLQSFFYDGAMDVSIAALLLYLNTNDDLMDIHNVRSRPIEWECSCLQKICGACAMVINGKPSLACSTFVNTLSQKEITIEPLSVFPVIQDLRVDRSIIFENIMHLGLHIEKLQPPKEKEYQYQYNSAKCLKCGLCLEVCPNYSKTSTTFYGPAILNEIYLTHSQNENKKMKKDIKKQYITHFSNHCSKSFACGNVCPLSMKPLSAMGLMNRK